MIMAVFFYVLVLTEDHGGLKAGHEIVGSKPSYSEQGCAEDARLVAQHMFVQNGSKYGFRCVKVDYEPPRVPSP